MFNLPAVRFALVCQLFICPFAGLASRITTQSQVEQVNENISFIGEVKRHSYIKLDLEPVKISSEFIAEGDDQLKYKGSYYESATGRKYRVTGVFSVESRSWTFRCFNSANREVFVFKGKQKQDGSIDGIWWSKGKKYVFYLRPQ